MIIRVGDHLLRHGDLMDGLTGLEVLRAEPADYVYCDPPWGSALLKMFSTMNHSQTGQRNEPVDIDPFLATLFGEVRASTHDDALVFVEYGLRGLELVLAHAERVGLRVLADARPTYGSSPPRRHALLTLAYHGRHRLPDGYVATVGAATGGMKTVLAATDPFPLDGRRILDPCCGLGYTARLAVLRRMTFFGNEVNLARLEKTLAILRKGAGR